MHRVKLNKKMYNTHKNYLGILIYQHINDKLFLKLFLKPIIQRIFLSINRKFSLSTIKYKFMKRFSKLSILKKSNYYKKTICTILSIKAIGGQTMFFTS